MSNRIQQVLRDARAMVEDPRPSTPATAGLDIHHHHGNGGGTLPFLLNGRRRPTALRNAHALPSLNCNTSLGFDGTTSVNARNHNNNAQGTTPLIPHSPQPQRRRLGTPPALEQHHKVSTATSTPTDLEFLVQSGKEAMMMGAGSDGITLYSEVGAKWQSFLNTDSDSNIEICLRAAANILRHSKDALLDAALAAVFEVIIPISEDVPPQATCKELRAEGVLDALMIACRSEDVLQNRRRLVLAADIIEVLSEEPTYHDLLVTHGIFLFIADALKETLRGFVFVKDMDNIGPVASEASLQNTTLDLLLFSVRNLCDSGKFAHHVLKTGIIDTLAPLLKNGVFTTVRVISKLSYHDECFAAMIKKPTPGGFSLSSTEATTTTTDKSSVSVLEALVRALGDDTRVKMDYLTLSRAVLAVARLLSGPSISSSSGASTTTFQLIESHIDELLACVETLLIARGPSSSSSSSQNNEDHENGSEDEVDVDLVHPASALPHDIRVDMIVAALLLLSGLTSSCVTSSSESGSYVQRVFVETGFVWCTLRNVLHEDWGNATINELALVCLSNYSYYLPVILGSTNSWSSMTTTPMKASSSSGGAVSPLTAMVPPSEAEMELVEDLTLAVCPFLFESDAEAAVEALRTLSNVALLRSGRDWMVENNVDEACTLFLGHEDPRVVFNSIGVLINMTSVDSTFLAGVGREEALEALLKHTGRLAALPDESEETKELVLKLLRNLQPSATEGAESNSPGCTHGQDAPTPVRRKPASGSNSPTSGQESTNGPESIYDAISTP